MHNEVLKAALHGRLIFVMGQKDTGKTTFVRELANELFRRGYSTGIIDTDVGQSDIGPPTTIGFGTVESVLEKLGDAVLQHFYFVGSTSPKGHLLSIITGVRKMFDKAFSSRIQKIIFDTTGLVSGQLGRVLKEHKIAIVNPDIIVCFQENHECEHILRPYNAFEKLAIIRLTPDSQCRKRTVTERRNYREIAFQNYFARARKISCHLATIGIFNTPLFSGEPFSHQQLKEFTEKLRLEKERPEEKDFNIQRSTFDFRLIWGECIGKEVLLVTPHKLEYDQFMQLKQHYPEITYVRNYTPDEFENMLVGILNKYGDFCALGILRSVDFSTRQATIYTPAEHQEIAGLKFSRYIMCDA